MGHSASGRSSIATPRERLARWRRLGPEQLVAPSASGEWVGLPLATPVSLSAGTYWLGMITGDTSKATVHFVGATPRAKVYIWDAYANGPANPAGPVTADTGPISIYAEYLP